MNRKEINEMMKDLPSQKHRETFWEKILVATMLIAVLVLLCITPDIYRTH
jgi:hypothetical protein